MVQIDGNQDLDIECDEISQLDGNCSLSDITESDEKLSSEEKEILEKELNDKEGDVTNKEFPKYPPGFEPSVKILEIDCNGRTRHGCDQCDFWSYPKENVISHKLCMHGMPANGIEVWPPDHVDS